jgi:serine/threonine protein kinase
VQGTDEKHYNDSSKHVVVDYDVVNKTTSTAIQPRFLASNAITPELSFGAALAEIFLLFSVLSKQDGPLRLPPLSDLHIYPTIGHGVSFVAHLVPMSRLKSDNPTLNGVSSLGNANNVVFKTLRHVEPPPKENERRPLDSRVNRLEQFGRELRVLTHNSLRNHENIVRLIGVGWETKRLSQSTSVFHWPFFVLEHSRYGTLMDWLDEGTASFEARRDLVVDVGLGLQALHGCDVVHGDVKSENVLVFYHPTRKYVAKIADFGYTMFDLDGVSPTTQRIGGTPLWNAPDSERALPWKEHHLSDVYSYGFLIWRTMSYGHWPFDRRGGLPSEEDAILLETLKGTDGLPEKATTSLSTFLLDSGLSKSVTSSLHVTLRLSRNMRSLKTCLNLLR